MRESNRTSKRLVASIVAVVALAICLCITTLALLYSTVVVDSNLFQTGEVKINLNDGEPVIEAHEFLFEPGMTVEKSFFIQNEGSCDVYYRLYFENLEGGLADVLEVSVQDRDTVLYSGKASDLTQETAGTADDLLEQNERRELTISFHYPQEAGNAGQGQYLFFALSADAVQVKNNPQRMFE